MEKRLNIELFKAVREKIATAPTAYRQTAIATLDERSPCGTAACIGGWADILSAPTPEEKEERMEGRVDLNRAANSLGLEGKDFWSELETERALLFAAFPEDWWPTPFSEQWRAAKSEIERTKIAVAYLVHIIETGRVLE